MNTSILIIAGIAIVVVFILVLIFRKKKDNTESSTQVDDKDCNCTNFTLPEHEGFAKYINVKLQDGSVVKYKAMKKYGSNFGTRNDYDFYDEFDNLVESVIYLDMLYDFLDTDGYIDGSEIDLFGQLEETIEEIDAAEQDTIAEEVNQEIIDEVEAEVEAETIAEETEYAKEVEYAEEPVYAKEPEYAPEPTYVEPVIETQRESYSPPAQESYSSPSESYSSDSGSDSGGGSHD